MGEIGNRFGGVNPSEADLGVLETFLSENIQDYDEVSDYLPEQYQKWLDQ